MEFKRKSGNYGTIFGVLVRDLQNNNKKLYFSCTPTKTVFSFFSIIDPNSLSYTLYTQLTATTIAECLSHHQRL